MGKNRNRKNKIRNLNKRNHPMEKLVKLKEEPTKKSDDKHLLPAPLRRPLFEGDDAWDEN